MTNLVLLNNIDHQDLKVITDRSAEFGDEVMHVLTFPFEFRTIQAYYPILFQQHGDDGMQAVALLGFEEGENLFLGEDGWSVSYIPAMIAREPFVIGFKDATDGSGEKTRMLSLDLDHPRVSRYVGEALFETLGGYTPYLERQANLLETIYQGAQHGQAFIKALQDANLFESVSFEITLKDGSRNQLLGFSAINEEKFQQLPAETLDDWRNKGFLMPAFMVLASMANIQKLIDLKNKKLDAE